MLLILLCLQTGSVPPSSVDNTPTVEKHQNSSNYKMYFKKIDFLSI